MIQTTTWYPDTCDCVIQYEWDSNVPEDKRSHKVSNILSACKCHSGEPADIFTSVLDENQLKNKVISRVLELNPDVKIDMISHEFDDARNLIISVAADISPDTEKRVQADLQTLDISIENK